MNSSPQRILFLPKWYPNPDDPQLGIFIREHAEALAQKVSVSLIHAYPDPQLQGASVPSIDRSRGFTEIFVRYRSSGPKPLRLYRYFKALQKGWRRLLREEPPPQLIHVHVLNRPACFAYFLRLQRKIPFVITEHWTGFIDGRAAARPLPTRWATRFLLRKSRGVSVVSEDLAQAFRDQGSAAPWVIPNSVHDPGAPRDLPKAPFRFLNVSDMVDERKNLSGLLEAFEGLVEDRSEDIELHIIGGGPDEELIRSIAQEKGLLEKGVRFYGRIANEEVQRILPSMSAVVVNSLFETFSVITVEALAHGRPVAATICGGPERIIEDGKDGFLYQKGDPAETRRTMEKLLETSESFDPQELHDRILSRFGRERVRERFLTFYTHCTREG